MGVHHQFYVRTNTAPGGLHPTHTLLNGKAIPPDHAHFDGAKPFGRVATEFGFRLVPWGPAATGIAANYLAGRTEGVIERDTQGLRLHVPDGNVHARNGL